ISLASRNLAISIAIVVLLTCGVLSSRQTRYWQDGFAVARRAIDVNPRSFAWQDRMASLLLSSGNAADAVEHSRAAVAARPEFALGWLHYGVGLSILDRDDEAEGAYRAVLRISPREATALSNLAGLLAGSGRLDEAIDMYRAALSINPSFADAQTGLARALR